MKIEEGFSDKCSATDDGKKYLLPFNNIQDLTRSYEKILAAHKVANIGLTSFLKENNIEYKEIEPCIVLIDRANVPDYIKIADLFNHIDKEFILSFYDNIGVIKN